MTAISVVPKLGTTQVFLDARSLTLPRYGLGVGRSVRTEITSRSHGPRMNHRTSGECIRMYSANCLLRLYQCERVRNERKKEPNT
jgi:hypothetical protein